MTTEYDRSPYRYGLIILIVLGFMFWGARSLWDSSEARYGQVAFEMLTNGNWLMPTLADQPHLSKPPFTYWMIAAGMKLFGINAWGARFFLAVFFTATLFCVRELAQTMGYGRKMSLNAAFIFATAIIPFIGGHTLTTDAFLTFWETFGILAAWKVWQAPGRSARIWRLMFWIAFGMGFFTKGPPALLPLAALAIFLWMRRGQGRGTALMSLPGLGLFIGLSLWWFVVLIVRQPDLLDYFWGTEVVGRIASNVHHRNAPFWIYAPIIVFGLGPWVLLWPRLVIRMYARFRRKMLLVEDRHLFLLLWFVTPLSVFVLAESRMPLYLMPLFVPLSLAMAEILGPDVIPSRLSPRKKHAAVIGLSVWILALTAFTVWPDQFPGSRSRRSTAKAFNSVLAGIEEPCRLYWAHGYAGREKYSIPFYMQQVVPETESFDRRTTEQAPRKHGNDTRALYIIKAKLLPFLQQTPDPPVVHAKAQDFALIEWPLKETSQMKPPRIAKSHYGAANASEPRIPNLHTAHRAGAMAALLLMLAGSRH
jgi:4-amino-4-deoxy-L-arabinose transferase